jgi:single-stranded-DNA-specific exonuclease
VTSNEPAADSLLRDGQATRWILREWPAKIPELAGCPAPLLPLLAARGIDSPEAARRFFTPSLDDLHDPLTMLGMTAAVRRIQAAVAAAEPILIYGDYDVDGTTATVLLKTAIERIALPDRPAIVLYHIPHRIREGYGMQTGVLGQAAQDGIRLVISVDTGIRAFAAAEEARALGLDLIVTDHHLPDGVVGLPDAVAVVNPAQPGCPYPNKHLCGAGVAFQLAHALLAAHAGTPQQMAHLKARLLPSFLKLVAIATIADSVELTGENRAIAWLGLRELANPVQPGLRALMRVAKLPLDRPPTATEVGFRLGPRINAAGRMDIAAEVVELFLTRDPDRADVLAEKLDTLNQQRRDTEAAALEAIEMELLTLCSATGDFPAQALVLDHPEWHRGVLGILASRVVERTGRPALVLCSGEPDGEAHGSGRSIAGYHLLDALTAIDSPSTLFARFGGHAHAVGFSLPAGRVGDLRQRLVEHSLLHLDPASLVAETVVDAELTRADLTVDLARWIARCAPFGIGNPEPHFLVRGLVVAGPPRIIKEKHLCLPLLPAPGCEPLNAMGWSRGSTPWSERASALKLSTGSILDAVVRLGENTHPQYGGLELQLVDFGVSREVAP